MFQKMWDLEMFQHFTHNETFRSRLDEADDQTRAQLLELIRLTHNLGLDWYFTNIPDLRCGRRAIEGERAGAVCFSIWIKNRNKILIRKSSVPGLEENMLPLTRAVVKQIRIKAENFSKNRVEDGQGRFPNEYFVTERSSSFDKLVKTSLDDNRQARLARLESAPPKPERRTLTVTIFQRNPNVVAEVLWRAEGKCERCHSTAPFRRQSNDTPYLEVHHKVPLMLNGDDTVDNAIALCPNCHRLAHHGYSSDWNS